MLFKLLESDCIALDRKIFAHLCKTGTLDEPVILPANFDSYVATIEQMLDLKSEAIRDREEAEAIEIELQAFETIDEDDKDDVPLGELSRLKEDREILISNATEKAENVKKICFSPVGVVTKVCPEMIDEAELVAQKYLPLMTYFARCHNIYNVARELTDEEIETLSSSITDLFSYLRTTFPEVSITPKLHMLEEHVLARISSCKVGLGFFGENGIEAIHHKINESIRNYGNMAGKQIDMIFCLYKDHLYNIFQKIRQ
ncbi:uncharacterized protein [Ptychodera flava]|uniref:uncharacterized protein n=1 Tax=Ptychodera flava TaxID=63121 RepID=UPI00396A8584